MLRSSLVAFAILACGAGSASADCAAELRAVIDRSDATFPRQSVMVSRSKAGETRMTMKAGSDRRYSTTTEMPTGTMGVILHDGKGWTSFGAGWQAIPDASAGAMTSAMVRERGRLLDTAKDPECLGVQSRDGKDYLVYRMRIDANGVVSQQTFHVDPASGLVASADYISSVKGDETTGTIAYTYGEPVEIAPPK